MAYVLLEYACRSCGARYESLEARSAIAKKLPHPPCGCAAVADRVVSAPKVKTCWASAVTTAKSDGPPGPAAMDTRALGEGMKLSEFRAKRSAMWRDRDRAAARARMR